MHAKGYYSLNTPVAASAPRRCIMLYFIYLLKCTDNKFYYNFKLVLKISSIDIYINNCISYIIIGVRMMSTH